VGLSGSDPEWNRRIETCAATLAGPGASEVLGPLAWPERELVGAIASRLDQCVTFAARQAEALRDALGDAALALALIDDPRSIVTKGTTARMRMIAELATLVTETPWLLTRKHLARAYSAGLGDEDVLHVVALAALIGHFDRMAIIVGEAVDPTLPVPPSDPATPPRGFAPEPLTGRPAIELARRPATAAAIAEWRSHAFYRDTPITRRQRTLVARWVATWLGDGGISPPSDLTVNPLDGQLQTVSETITLAPWRIDDSLYTPLRTAGFDDVAIFDVCATATSAGVFSRIEVALAALST
jgi:alkylhydroperoxidase family enzyme